jgi:hypothetical protein
MVTKGVGELSDLPGFGFGLSHKSMEKYATRVCWFLKFRDGCTTLVKVCGT